MNIKHLLLMSFGVFAIQAITVDNIFENTYDKKKKVIKKVSVSKKSNINDASTLSKNIKKSDEIASVSKSVNIEAMSKAERKMFSVYMDINEKDFNKPKFNSFKAAFKGYYQLKSEGKIKKEILTIIDFSLSSTEKRMWVIDMKKNEIVFQSVVSHGKNSGKEYATDFSNVPESHKSSLGFYKTAETYQGKHGLSLRLDGLEYGINHNARMRDIVIHGADYANERVAESQGWLGRSFGCPALPYEWSSKIINYIKEESCLFIYQENNIEYEKKSKYL